MREIKFRVWHKELKKMFKVADLNNISWGSRVYSNNYLKGYMKASMQDENIELMQFTGLKDSKNVDIYEGDILKFVNMHGRDSIHEVYFDSGIFLPVATLKLYDGKQNFEIIGNVWENPELLPKENKI